MNHVEQFVQLLEKNGEQQLIPFLRSLDTAQKKDLVPHIKKLSKHYNEYIQTRNNYDFRGTTTQRNMLQTTSFVCYSLADYERSAFSLWFLNEKSF